MSTRTIICCLLFIHLAALVFCSGPLSISTEQKDVTTPITTVPTVNPSTEVINPISSNPEKPMVMNPNNPSTIPLETNTRPVGSWCIAMQSVPQAALQVALDYACGHGGADCSAVQPGGRCYYPNTVRDHASYAFNSYYQMNPIPASCNFGGAAVITSTNPSYDSCQFPTTSTSSSVLNISSSSGSHVFGAGRPYTPTTSAVVMSRFPSSNWLLASVAVLLFVPRCI
ncbi:carbohydrate-binding X8 domain superfamily protein [Striga asiatica]|uniref:Carbohydrate-binding X8 domain superfamily protein n=1 Tax=Striga asiatica TaxID=4170 RepID=A0A5A7R817_STRAF|nr:carbohydrate-binding X8 domain superfamily protein [Striga asiatica]